MLQPIKIIMIAACTLLPVINESRSFAESADRKKAYKSRAKEAFKSSVRRQSRSSRNDKRRSRPVTRKASRPKVSSKNKSSRLQSRSSRNDEKRSNRGITRKTNRPQVSSQNKAQRKLKSLTAKSRRDRDNGKHPIAKLPNQDRGKRPILKLPIVKPDTDRDRGKRSIGKLPILKPDADRDRGKRPIGKLPILKPDADRDRGKRPIGKLPILKPDADRDRGKRPIGKLPILKPDADRDRGKRPIGKPLVDKIPIDKLPIDKLPIDKLRDGKLRDGKLRDGKLRDGKLRDGKLRDGKIRDGKIRDGKRRIGSGKPNIGLERFKDVLRDRVGRKPDLRKKVDWKDLRGGLSRIRDRSSYHVESGLSNQYRRSRRMALSNLTLGSHCHWWLDFVVGHCWDTHHCHWWDYCETPGYWDCWTPCHFRVIHCPPSAGIVATSWYFGIDCILIPDLSAYGIQKVNAGSPADMAGLVVGDMIVGINGGSITSEFDLSEAITVSDGHLHLDVIRDGADSPVEIHVDLARLAVQSY